MMYPSALMYIMEKREGYKTVPWGAPVFVMIPSDGTEGLNMRN